VGAGQFPWRQRATQLWHCLRRPHDARVDVHERIASRVYRRLRQRHIQLQVAEREASEYLAHRAWEQDYAHAHSKAISGDGAATSPWPSRKREERSSSNRNHISKHPDAIAYRLATADLFVEKAIAYLEEHAASYKPRANSVHATPIIILLFVTPHAIMRERNGAGIVEMTHQLITMGGGVSPIGTPRLHLEEAEFAVSLSASGRRHGGDWTGIGLARSLEAHCATCTSSLPEGN